MCAPADRAAGADVFLTATPITPSSFSSQGSAMSSSYDGASHAEQRRPRAVDTGRSKLATSGSVVGMYKTVVNRESKCRGGALRTSDDGPCGSGA
jgi:hypothetical protein